MISKKRKLILQKVEQRSYSLKEAVVLLKSFASKNFRESVDLSVILGIDPRKPEQNIRGAVVLPKGTGVEKRVAVFAPEDKAAIAKEVGADLAGLEDLVAQVKAGELNFDIAIATPDAMRTVGQLGQILGPRGLMPNPKDGTVTTDIKTAVTNAKAGQVRYRTDKAGIIHCMIGKIDFDEADLFENVVFLLARLKKVKPVSSKGVYMKKVTISSTMGPGLQLDLSGMDF